MYFGKADAFILFIHFDASCAMYIWQFGHFAWTEMHGGRVCQVCVCVWICWWNRSVKNLKLSKRLLHLFFLWKLIWELLDPSGSELYSQPCMRTCWCLCKIVPCCSFCHLWLWHHTTAVMPLPASLDGLWQLWAHVRECVCEAVWQGSTHTQRQRLDGKVVI